MRGGGQETEGHKVREAEERGTVFSPPLHSKGQ